MIEHNTQHKTITTSGELLSSDMTLDREGMHMAISILRDKMYSNKVLAVLREYWANARDEHVKHDIERPVLVTLPTINDPVLRVRDYAKGLSRHDAFNVYGMYFKSTKNQENVSIGGKGLGSKSGHAYGDAFTVTSFFEGTKSVYECVLESDEETGHTMGRMYLLDESPTDESGIEVSLNVRPIDVSMFEREFKQLMTYVPDNERPIVRRGNYVVDLPKPARHPVWPYGDGWYRQYNSYQNMTMVMGGIGYEIQISLFNEDNHFTAEMKDLLRQPLVVDFPIGSLSIAPNREALEYTNRTKTLIRQRVREIQRDIEKWIEDQIDSAPDVLKAKARLGDITRSFTPTWHRNKTFQYKGQDIRPGVTFNGTFTVYDDGSSRHSHGTGEVEGRRVESVSLEGDDRLYYLCADKNAGGLNRARTLWEQNTDRIVVFQYGSTDERDLYFEKNDLSTAFFTDWETVEKAKPQRTRTTSGKRSSIGKSHLHHWNPNRYSYRDKFARFHGDVPEKAVYVILDYKQHDLAVNRPENQIKGEHIAKYTTGVLSMISLIDDSVPVMAVKHTAKASKIPAGWQTVEQYITEKVKDADVLSEIQTACVSDAVWNAMPSIDAQIKTFSERSDVPRSLRDWMKEVTDAIAKAKPNRGYGARYGESPMTRLALKLGLIDTSGVQKAEAYAKQYERLLAAYPIIRAVMNMMPSSYGSGRIEMKDYKEMLRQIAEYLTLAWENPFTETSCNKQKEAA